MPSARAAVVRGASSASRRSRRSPAIIGSPRSRTGDCRIGGAEVRLADPDVRLWSRGRRTPARPVLRTSGKKERDKEAARECPPRSSPSNAPWSRCACAHPDLAMSAQRRVDVPVPVQHCLGCVTAAAPLPRAGRTLTRSALASPEARMHSPSVPAGSSTSPSRSTSSGGAPRSLQCDRSPLLPELQPGRRASARLVATALPECYR